MTASRTPYGPSKKEINRKHSQEHPGRGDEADTRKAIQLFREGVVLLNKCWLSGPTHKALAKFERAMQLSGKGEHQ